MRHRQATTTPVAHTLLKSDRLSKLAYLTDQRRQTLVAYRQAYLKESSVDCYTRRTRGT